MGIQHKIIMWCHLWVNFVENVLLYCIILKVVLSIKCNGFALRMMEKCKKKKGGEEEEEKQNKAKDSF